MLRDPEFGPIRLRAFGTYTLKCTDPRILLKELVGTDSEFDSNEINELMRSIITEAFTSMLGEQQIAALDLASKYREMSGELRKYVIERVDDEYGLDVPALFIVNISLPEAVEKALDTRTSMGVIGDMGKFQAYQMGNAMEAAANNPAGGGAAEGMGLGMGFAMANRMATGAAGQPQAGYPQGPPPPPQATAWHVAVNGQTKGPFNDQQLAQMISGGEVSGSTTIWCAGMPGWQPATQVPQLAAYFQAAPPPPPPPV
jgi:membrane protease subunit (stomatin/prohibitin family)